MAKTQTPLTLELFQEILMPQIKLLISETIEKELEEKFNEKLSYLPTKEEFFTQEDKVMKELKSLREEVAITGDLYKKTNKRVDLVDKHLGIDTSTVF